MLLFSINISGIAHKRSERAEVQQGLGNKCATVAVAKSAAW